MTLLRDRTMSITGRPPQADNEAQRLAGLLSWPELSLWVERGWPIPASLRGAARQAALRAMQVGEKGAARQIARAAKMNLELLD